MSADSESKPSLASGAESDLGMTPVLDEAGLARAKELSLSRVKPPLRVPGYEQEEYLGRGAFGEVWKAVDSNSGRVVAIKFYSRRGGLDWSHMTREVEKLQYLFSDRHVVQLFDVGWEATPPYYVMEYMAYGSLEDRLKEAACCNCPQLTLCMQTERRIRTARQTYANLAEEIGRIESYQPAQVKKRLNLLKSLGYIENGHLSAKGRAASWVYGYELQTAELLFSGFFDRMDEDQMSILATAIICDSREREWYKPAPKDLLGDVFYKADKCIDQLRRREQLFGIKGVQVKLLDSSLTGAVYAWGKEKCEFEELRKYTDASEGDLVRALRMTIDLLRQTQRAVAGHSTLHEKLENSVKKINRGVVDAERQLRGRMEK